MPGTPSRFLDSLPPGVVEERRSSGMFGGDLYSRPEAPRAWTSSQMFVEPEEVSQDAPRYVKGERVLHRRFGSGTIAEISGRGKDLKAVIRFDDEEVGTKQLLVAYAGLERDWESA